MHTLKFLGRLCKSLYIMAGQYLVSRKYNLGLPFHNKPPDLNTWSRFTSTKYIDLLGRGSTTGLHLRSGGEGSAVRINNTSYAGENESDIEGT